MERAEVALAAFAHTAVVIDDEWGVNDEPGVISGLKAPGLGAGRGTEDSGGASRRSGHPLDTRTLMQAFASKGIVCSVLRPGTGSRDPVAAALEPATGRADFVVLDWHIDDDDGQRTIEYVKTILASDEHRIRLLTIYTGDGDFNTISASLIAGLDGVIPLEKADEEGHVLVGGPATITLLGKSIATHTGAPSDRVVSEEDLPSRLISELASRLVGLIPAATLHSLAALRRNAYRVLEVLSNRLDVGYLGHRVLLPDTEDAQGHVVDLVLSELETVIRGEEAVHEAAGAEAIAAWLATRDLSDDERALLRLLSVEGFEAVKSTGRHMLDGRTVPRKWPAKTLDRGGGEVSGAEFAMRMTLQSTYSNSPSWLTLGAVLHEATADAYFLCLQPLCDSVRLKAPTAFPLLPCAVAAGESCDFVLPPEGESTTLTRLKMSDRPRDLVMVTFDPDPEREVVLPREARQFISDSGHTYRQVARFKPAIGGVAAHSMGHAFSRPGADVPEFLRELRSALGRGLG